jgi:hypothetical protein
MMSPLAAIGLIAVVGFAYGSEPTSNITRILQVPGAEELVVVAEGEFEPRSVGSYTLRVYGRMKSEFPLDGFITGVLRPRSGTIEKVLFENLDRADTIAIVVVIRSTGSGGYLSADGFRYRARSVELLGSVAELDRLADPVIALRDKLQPVKESDTGP